MARGFEWKNEHPNFPAVRWVGRRQYPERHFVVEEGPVRERWMFYFHTTILGPYHRCGSQEYYTNAWWLKTPLQCAPCHRRRVAARAKEWRAEQRTKRERPQRLIRVLEQLVRQLT